jgi:dienelactone hydrolase
VKVNLIRSLASPIFGILLFWSSAGLAVQDPFVPYLSSIPPVLQSLSQTNSGAGPTAITTKKFTLSSRSGMNTVYAVEAFPQQAGVYPGLFILHGGGGNADGLLPLVEEYARGGYVALAIDQPGICGTNNTPNTTGPWKSRPTGEVPRFDVTVGPQNSTLVDAEVAGLEGLNWLRSQTNVNPTAVGITGFSWGGYSTTMLSGLLGDKVKAAYAVFGCGFYEKGSFWKARIAALSMADRDVWLTYLDAGRREAQMKAAYFLEAETNDTYFWPEAVGATIDAVPGTKNHVWGPNLNHMQLAAGPAMQRLYFDYYLKGIGSDFASVRVSKIEVVNGADKKVTFDVSVPTGVSIASVELYYSNQAPTWQSRTWTAITAQLASGTTYSATIPANLAAQQLNFYGFVTDTRMVSTSTGMFDSSSIVPTGDGGILDDGAVGVDGAPSPDGALSSDGPSSSDAPATSAPPIDAAGTDATSLQDSNAGGGSNDASSSASAPPTNTTSSGCACRATSAMSTPWDGLALIVLSSVVVAGGRRRLFRSGAGDTTTAGAGKTARRRRTSRAAAAGR